MANKLKIYVQSHEDRARAETIIEEAFDVINGMYTADDHIALTDALERIEVELLPHVAPAK